MAIILKNKSHRSLLREEDSIIVHGGAGKEIIEAYTRLKDNVLYFAIDGKKKVIQIESSTSSEGKTTLIANLAVSLADNQKKVLVIDLDLRKPRLHRTFGIENTNGITDYLVNNISKEELIKHTKYEVDVITRGTNTENTSLILTSEKLADFIGSCRENYDFILIDCPPILVASDYIHISRITDGVLFVLAYGMTKKVEVKEAMSEIRKNNIDVIGSVFTFYDQRKVDYYEYNNYNYYYSKGDK